MKRKVRLGPTGQSRSAEGSDRAALVRRLVGEQGVEANHAHGRATVGILATNTRRASAARRPTGVLSSLSAGAAQSRRVPRDGTARAWGAGSFDKLGDVYQGQGSDSNTREHVLTNW